MLTDALTIAPAGWTVLQVRTCASLEFVDLTERLASLACGVSSGVMHVFTRHTTTGLLINEAEPLLLEDLAARLERWAPATDTYHHDDFSRRVVNVCPRRAGQWACALPGGAVSFIRVGADRRRRPLPRALAARAAGRVRWPADARGHGDVDELASLTGLR